MFRAAFGELRRTRDHFLRLSVDAWSGALDLIYPPHCLICERDSASYLCGICLEKIDIIKPPRCHRCGTPGEAYYCSECREREFVFESNVSVGAYDGVLREAIHKLKYGGCVVLAESLAELMARCFPSSGLANKVDIAVPIPVHRSRLLERGYNQSEELACRFCARTGLPIELTGLKKHRHTRHQVELSSEARLSNLEGAFVVSGDSLFGKRVLLIDDVYTTGSTLNSAADAIKRAGAAVVYAYTLARSL